MDIYILDKSFNSVAVVDCFKSLIWAKRYYKCGDFELYIPANTELLPLLQKDFFVVREDDDTVMIIERVFIQTDAENGDYFIISGRSLESILARRVVLSQTVIETSDVVQGIKYLVTRHTGNGDPDSYRAFPNFTIDDSLQISEDYKAQFTGQVLLDAVSSICQRFQIGFKMSLLGSNIVLSFYQGAEVDVVFSPEFDNIINSQYVTDSSNLSNYAIVAGQGEGSSRFIVNVPRATPSERGFELREIWVDARDIQSNGSEIPTTDYAWMLSERGREKLAEHDVSSAFDAEIEASMTFAYKTDYHLGDIVTVTNEYGITANPRIVEVIESWDESGYKVVPKFDALEVQ